MIRTSLLTIALFSFVAGTQADELQVIPKGVDGVAPQALTHQYLMGLTREALDRSDRNYEELKTSDDLLAHQKRMRDFFFQQLGELPERTPLEPKVVGQLQRDGYRIEKVIYQSQPRHFVTAVLYLPATKPPYPGVLVPCGHTATGKAGETYQRACILLAKNGLAVLCYDPIDQGERFNLFDEQGKPCLGGTTGHSMAGVGAILVGRNTATYRIWDGMRSIDYLQSRPEVDADRIGCTGNSGGGTLTSYLMALDPRIKVAAPSCYLTSMRRLMETIGAADAEQDIHAQIAFGMGHADYVLMRAPKPTLMCTATHDFFDIQGSWDTFRRAKRFYTRMDFAERVDLVETDAKHGFSTQLRVAAVRWMRRWLLNIDDAITEPDFPIATVEELQCSPQGQVMRIDGARNVYDLNAELESKYAPLRKKFWKDTDPKAALAEVRRITGIRPLEKLPEITVKKMGQIDRQGYRIDKLILTSKNGLPLPALAFVPQRPASEAMLYVNGNGKSADAAQGGPFEKLALNEGGSPRVVLAVDLCGLGELGVSDKSRVAQYVGPNWKDIFLAYMLDRPYLTLRAEQILACARFLAGYESADSRRPVHLVAIGECGPPALHAAALEQELFASLLLKQSLVSWVDVVRQPLARNQLANVIHGALKVYDLPDLVAVLPSKKVSIRDPQNALGEPIPSKP